MQRSNAIGVILLVVAFAAAATFSLWREARATSAALDAETTAAQEWRQKGWELIDEVVRLEGLVQVAGQSIIEAVETETQLRAELANLQSDVAHLTDQLAVANARGTPQPTPTPTSAPALMTETGTLRCTGSMEPALTCLDRVIWQRGFRLEDIAVGDVIMYAPDCNGEPNRIVHRIVKAKEVGGTYYYQTKGDAVAEVDDCWVPGSHVLRYMVSVERGVMQENAYLREQVQAAQAALIAAVEWWGNLPVEAQRTIGSSSVERAAAHFQCWYDSAVESQYPGHIPNECG